jgi:hypothetical protein
MLPYTPNEEINKTFLKSPLKYDREGDLYSDTDTRNYVMMEWERPMMQDISRYLCEGNNLSVNGKVLNIGFGMGMVDEYIQEYKPLEHWIIEGHSDVCKKMITGGWEEKKGVKCFFNRWQDIYEDLPEDYFDAIYFDTYQDHEQHLFADRALKLIKIGGRLSFFNDFFINNIDESICNEVDKYYKDWLPSNFKMDIKNTYIDSVTSHSSYNHMVAGNYYVHVILEREW